MVDDRRQIVLCLCEIGIGFGVMCLMRYTHTHTHNTYKHRHCDQILLQIQATRRGSEKQCSYLVGNRSLSKNVARKELSTNQIQFRFHEKSRYRLCASVFYAHIFFSAIFLICFDCLLFCALEYKNRKKWVPYRRWEIGGDVDAIIMTPGNIHAIIRRSSTNMFIVNNFVLIILFVYRL